MCVCAKLLTARASSFQKNFLKEESQKYERQRVRFEIFLMKQLNGNLPTYFKRLQLQTNGVYLLKFEKNCLITD